MVGGGDLAGESLDAGALAEFRRSIAPLALTGGAPLLQRNVGAERWRPVSASVQGQFARLLHAVTD